MRKILKTLALALFASVPAFGCWYNRIDYNDYIYSVNGIARAFVTNTFSETTVYATNNITVDFPVTVDVKLVSDSAVVVGDQNSKTNLLKCILQYRTLPSGSWVTAEKYDVPTGSIPMGLPPGPYLGRNNVWPQGCKAGDVVMIRLYVTDGFFQSGDLADMCEDRLENGRLPYYFTYKPRTTPILDVDLGGYWTPQYVVTVIWSGKTRPVQ